MYSLDNCGRAKIRRGVKYKVYETGYVYTLDDKYVTKIDDHYIVDYIFDLQWNTAARKKKLDKLIEGQPDSFKELLIESSAGPTLGDLVREANSKNPCPMTWQEVEAFDNPYDEMLKNILDSDIKTRLLFILKYDHIWFNNFRVYKEMRMKTIIEAILKLWEKL